MNSYDQIKGHNKLTDEQKQIFERVYTNHLATMGNEMRKNYSIENIREVKWDKINNTVNTYFKNGSWWHYDINGHWY